MSTRASDGLRRIGATAARILWPAVAAYGLLLGLSFWLHPPLPPGHLDVAETEASFFSDPLAYAAHRSTALASDRPAVVLLGASNVEFGFRPPRLAEQMPGVDVFNLALGNIDVDGMAELVGLAYANRPPRRRDGLVFVVGLWYGQFRYDTVPVGSLVVRQMQRFGLFQRGTDGFERALPPIAFDVAVTLLRPFFLVRRILAPDNARLLILAQGAAARPDAASPCRDGDRPNLDEGRFDAAGQLPETQFAGIARLAELVRRRGGHIVLVDLPLPSCATANSVAWRQYQRQKVAWLEIAGARGAIYLDLQDMHDDGDFLDATHPRPATARKWEARLVAALKAAGLPAPAR